MDGRFCACDLITATCMYSALVYFFTVNYSIHVYIFSTLVATASPVLRKIVNWVSGVFFHRLNIMFLTVF